MNNKTGRTTRMICFAVDQAKATGRHFIICANKGHLSGMRARITQAFSIDEKTKLHPFEVYLKGGGQISLRTVDNSQFDWATLRCGGVAPEVGMSIDHYAIEYKYNLLLKEFHKWDAKY